MSGGSLNYAFRHVEEAAEHIAARGPTTLHRAFAKHLQLVATALHDIEWVYSFDYSKGGDVEAINACLAPGAELTQAVAEAKEAQTALEAAIQRILDAGGEHE